jgi:SEC-C motif domain protein
MKKARTPSSSPSSATAASLAACPCGGAADVGAGALFEQCCGRYLGNDMATPAPTPEALMRSRYSAFVRADEAYLLATWHASTRPPIALSSDGTQWLGLQVKHASSEGEHGVVEFVARYKLQGRAHRLHEVSRFVQEQGRWYYLDGEHPDPKVKSAN